MEPALIAPWLPSFSTLSKSHKHPLLWGLLAGWSCQKESDLPTCVNYTFITLSVPARKGLMGIKCFILRGQLPYRERLQYGNSRKGYALTIVRPKCAPLCPLTAQSHRMHFVSRFETTPPCACQKSPPAGFPLVSWWCKHILAVWTTVTISPQVPMTLGANHKPNSTVE